MKINYSPECKQAALLRGRLTLSGRSRYRNDKFRPQQLGETADNKRVRDIVA